MRNAILATLIVLVYGCATSSDMVYETQRSRPGWIQRLFEDLVRNSHEHRAIDGDRTGNKGKQRQYGQRADPPGFEPSRTRRRDHVESLAALVSASCRQASR